MTYFKLKIFHINTEDTPSFLYPDMQKASAQPHLSSVGKP